MKETLILLKVQGVQGSDGQQRFCVWWYLKGGDPQAPDGGVCCDDLKEGLRHIQIALEEDLKDRPELSDPELVTGPFRRIAATPQEEK